MSKTTMRTIEIEMNVDETSVFFNIYTPIDGSRIKNVIVEGKGVMKHIGYEFKVHKSFVKVVHNYVFNIGDGIYYDGELIHPLRFTPAVLHSTADLLVVAIDQGRGSNVYLIENNITKLLFSVCYISEHYAKDGEIEVMLTAPQGVADVMNKEEFLKLALNGVNDRSKYAEITHAKA